MKRLSILTKNGPVKQFDGELERTDNDWFERRIIPGRLIERKENFVNLLGSSENGELELMIDGRPYRFANLASDGSFDAIPKSA